MSDSFNPQSPHLDFTQYIKLSRSELLKELTDSHQNIANLAISIAYLKGEEERGTQHAKELRRQMEGTQAAYTEKKWLLKTLIEYAE